MALRIERWMGRNRGGAAEVWLAQAGLNSFAATDQPSRNAAITASP